MGSQVRHDWATDLSWCSCVWNGITLWFDFLICISLRIDDVEYLFKCVLYLSVFSGEVSIQVLHHFIRLFAFLSLNCRVSRYILDINPLLDRWFTNIFSQSVGYLFHSMGGLLWRPKGLSLMQSSLFFIAVTCALGVIAKKPLPNQIIGEAFGWVFKKIYWSIVDFPLYVFL